MKSLTEIINEHALADTIESQYDGAEINLYEKNNKITLSKIVIPKKLRGQGIGSEIMNKLCKYADDNNKTIILTPSVDFGASSVNRLKSFYKSFGFVINAGKNKDFEISNSMYRLPK